MSPFPHHRKQRGEPDAKTSSLAHAILLLVTALLIWSVLSRPMQFFGTPDATTQHCVYFGRAGANCSAEAHPDAPEPRRQ